LNNHNSLAEQDYLDRHKKVEHQGFLAGLSKKQQENNPYTAGHWDYEIWEESRLDSYPNEINGETLK
jgi:hypothetical protein